MGASRAAPGLARPDVSLSRGHLGAPRRRHSGRAPPPALRTCAQSGLLAALRAARAEEPAMRRALLALLAFLALAPAASAHPLGNFTINHLSAVTISSDRVDVVYTIDQAEIPTFQER